MSELRAPFLDDLPAAEAEGRCRTHQAGAWNRFLKSLGFS